MPNIPIAVQLYSVRDAAAADLPGVLKAIKTMGYDGVEFAGYYDYSAEQLKQLLADTGLECVGTHVGIDTLLGDEFEKSVEFHATLGNTRPIVPGLPGEYTASADAWEKTADTFNEIAAKLKPHGMRTGYHNHHTEYTVFETGKTPWDILFDNTDEAVIMQLDTGNAMAGDGEPIPLVKGHPGRAVSVHLKPYSPSLKVGDDITPGYRPAIGEDETDWKALLEACESVGGVEVYVVEYESDKYPAMEAIEICLKNLKSIMG